MLRMPVEDSKDRRFVTGLCSDGPAASLRGPGTRRIAAEPHAARRRSMGRHLAQVRGDGMRCPRSRSGDVGHEGGGLRRGRRQLESGSRPWSRRVPSPAAESSRTPSNCGTRSVGLAATRWSAPAGACTAVGLANQGETVLAWDLHDGQSAQCSRLLAGSPCGFGLCRPGRTRCGVDPDHRPAARPLLRGAEDDVAAASGHLGEGVVTTSDAWLVHRLTGAYVTDVTTASRTYAARPGSP